MNKPISLFIEELESRVAPSASIVGAINASDVAKSAAADQAGLTEPVFTTLAVGEEDPGGPPIFII